MCVSRFNPTEPCCGDEPPCQACALVNWERYTYAISFDRIQTQLGTTFYQFENGELVTVEDSEFAHNTWLQAHRTPMFRYGLRCVWNSIPVQRGIWRWGVFDLSLPDYDSERRHLLSQYNQQLVDFQFPPVSDEPEFLANLWYFWTYKIRAQAGSAFDRLEGLDRNWDGSWGSLFSRQWGAQTGSDEDTINTQLGSSRFFWSNILHGFALQLIESRGAPSEFRLRLFLNDEQYQPIPLKDWRCFGPNVFEIQPGYTGPRIPARVTVELIPKKDGNRVFHAIKDAASNVSGIFLLTQLPDT